MKRLAFMTLSALLIAVTAAAQERAPELAPPADVVVKDHPWDGGDKIDLSWALSADDAELAGYKIYRTLTEMEVTDQDAEELRKAEAAAKDAVTEALLEAKGLEPDQVQMLTDAEKVAQRAERDAAGEAAKAAKQAEIDGRSDPRYEFVGIAKAGESEYVVEKLERGQSYMFMIEAFTTDDRKRSVATANPVTPTRQVFDGTRTSLAIITLILCGAVVYWIWHARSGRPIRVRKIAGLEAVDEAVGRATEMGRSCLFIPGIQDMNDIQTIAGLTVLARVAKTAAEYDAKVEVPTSRSLVMTTARETVQASFLAAGRPDSYNQDLIYYVTDEQFGYVAYLSGMMVREKPAACFYMGSFFAESLILAETGNSIGAIQIAGTAQPAQLPFFVAACDYTLIGEEFFAASAYLSGSAEELGSLKGQDVGKVIVAVFMIIGIFFATGSSLMPDNQAMKDAVTFIQDRILS